MTSVFDSVDTQLVLFIAALVVVLLTTQLFFRVLKVGFGPILGILAIVLGLQYLFGLSPKELWFEVSHLPQMALGVWQRLT